MKNNKLPKLLRHALMLMLGSVACLSTGSVCGEPSLVKDGKLVRNQPIKILRGKDVAGTGKISGLKRFKEDVKEVEKGLECGILIEGFKDYRVGDIVEAVTKEEKVRRITHA